MILREQIWFSMSKFIEQIFAHNKFAHCSNSWFSMSKINSPWANLILREQIYWANFCFCRRQQQDNHAGRSSFEPARHGTEMVSPPAGAYIPSFTIYHVLPDIPVDESTSTTSIPFHLSRWIFLRVLIRCLFGRFHVAFGTLSTKRMAGAGYLAPICSE